MNCRNTADQAFVRETNRSLVLRLIHNQHPLSRAQPAGITGLNRPTDSSLVDELSELGLAHETGGNIGGTGCQTTLFAINIEVGQNPGVELGLDFVSTAMTEIRGNNPWCGRKDASPVEGQDKMIDQTSQIAKDATSMGKRKGFIVLSLGLATPGTVDIKKGILIFSPNHHWHDNPFVKISSEWTKIKIMLENDENAAAIAEHLSGITRLCQDHIFFVFAGIGTGGGLFLTLGAYRGRNGYSGGIGHSPIMTEPLQKECHCGERGCWEADANHYSIIQRVQARLELKRSGIIPGLLAEQNMALSIPRIKQAADAGDREALDSFNKAGHAMGHGSAGLINVSNPERIILGGPLNIAGEYMLPASNEAADPHAFPAGNCRVDIPWPPFRSDASLSGAAAILADNILNQSTIVGLG